MCIIPQDVSLLEDEEEVVIESKSEASVDVVEVVELEKQVGKKSGSPLSEEGPIVV